MAQVIYPRWRPFLVPWHKLYTTMELVPVPLVPTCATKWVYKAVECFAVFAPAPPSLVFADAGATAFFTLAPPSLVFAQTATTAVSALGPWLIVFTDAVAPAVYALVPPPLVFADAAASAVFTRAPLLLVFAEPAITAVFALGLLPLVYAELCTCCSAAGVRRAAGLLDCGRMCPLSCWLVCKHSVAKSGS